MRHRPIRLVSQRALQERQRVSLSVCLSLSPLSVCLALPLYLFPVCLSFSPPLSLTHTHTLSVSFYLLQERQRVSLYVSLSPSLYFSLKHTVFLPLFVSHTHTLSPSLSFLHTHCLSLHLPLSLSLTHTVFLSISLLSLSLSLRVCVLDTGDLCCLTRVLCSCSRTAWTCRTSTSRRTC